MGFFFPLFYKPCHHGSPGSPREKVMFLKHYRASSNGTVSRSCRACEVMFEGIYDVHLQCRSPDPCTCTACRRQPPSLKASASQIVFRFVYDIENFRFDPDTTYDMYTYVWCRWPRSRVSINNLCPFPHPISIRFFWYSSTGPISRQRYHEKCVPAINAQLRHVWRTHTLISFPSSGEFVISLVLQKERFWCAHCEKALFELSRGVKCIVSNTNTKNKTGFIDLYSAALALTYIWNSYSYSFCPDTSPVIQGNIRQTSQGHE